MRRIGYGLKKEMIQERSINPDDCLAKTDGCDSAGFSVPGMNVYQHCRGTGLVAGGLREMYPYLESKGFFPKGFQLIAALHDVGKIYPDFQKRIISNLPEASRLERMAKLGLENAAPLGNAPPHPAVSQAALREVMGDSVAYIGGAHHGAITQTAPVPTSPIAGGKPWQDARMMLLSQLENVFGSDAPQEIPQFLVDFLLGLVIVSDWISSSVSLADLMREGDSIFIERVSAAGFHRHSYRQGLSFKDIFGFDMRPEQNLLADMVAGPGAYVLEAGMGSGKTEAALYCAYRILAAGKGEGLYFALPTAMTSREIYKRVVAFLGKVLVNEEADAKLVFGGSTLDNVVFSGKFTEPGWFDSRKRLILAPFGVGTIDQALMSVIAVRHSAVRAFGLAGKVVILDEVHSYDSYTSNLIDRLVRELRDLGATVIILSATLRSSSRRSLLGLSDSHVLPGNYPSVTAVDESGNVSCKGLEENSVKTVILEHEENYDRALDKAVEEALLGRYVLWIENTVDEAQAAYRTMAARCDGLCEVGLLHSRFTGADRRKKERRYVQMYGKDSWESRASGPGCILIGTQVLEQSLDIDADVLFTRLAPADMIFQRIGRLWRHNHVERAGNAVCHLIHPPLQAVEADPNVLGPSAAVYEPFVLYKSLRSFCGRNTLLVPRDIRPILEEVYDDSFDCSSLPRIKGLLRKLNEHRAKLEALAIRAQARIGQTLPDEEVCTRYSELETSRVLILSRVDIVSERLWLTDGRCLELSKAKSPESRARISFELEESMLNVPVNRVPDLSVNSAAILRLLSGFVYVGHEGSEKAMTVLLSCRDSDRLADAYGNEIPGFFYSPATGYNLEKRRANC